MSAPTRPCLKPIDELYADAVAMAGEAPNMLGFLRRVRASKHYRPNPRHIGGYNNDADDTEIRRARAAMSLAIQAKRW